MASRSRGTMPGACAPSTSVSIPARSSSRTSSATGKIEGRRARHMTDQGEPRARGHAGQDRLRHLPWSRMGKGISATTTRAPARSAANVAALRAALYSWSSTRISSPGVEVQRAQDGVDARRSRWGRRPGRPGRRRRSPPARPAPRRACPSSCAAQEVDRLGFERSCQARWAARTARGRAPKEPWLRNVTEGSRVQAEPLRHQTSVAHEPARTGNAPAATSSARWHATRSPGPRPLSGIVRKSGSSVRQRSMAIGQRVLKRQPVGGLIGLGTSPSSGIRRRTRSVVGSGIGADENSARVYGCSGDRYSGFALGRLRDATQVHHDDALAACCR